MRKRWVGSVLVVWNDTGTIEWESTPERYAFEWLAWAAAWRLALRALALPEVEAIASVEVTAA